MSFFLVFLESHTSSYYVSGNFHVPNHLPVCLTLQAFLNEYG